MIFDHRTYNIKPNRSAKFLETYERLALPLQRKYLGEPYGFFVTHIGPLSRAEHPWQYEDLGDREQRRDAMEADPEWQAYRRIALEEDTLVDMENHVLKPARPALSNRKGKVMQQNNAATARPIKVPGPEHPITIERNPKRVVVSSGWTVLADSRDALILREADYPAVQYIPRKDVDMMLLERSAHATYCPYKGDCAYFSIPSGGERAINAVWTYEAPYEPLGFLPR